MKDLLIRYITKQATDAESTKVREWIRQGEANELYYIQLYEAWHESLLAQDDILNPDDAYALFLSKVKHD